jgi:ATP-binding cassette subfamily F protein 3
VENFLEEASCALSTLNEYFYIMRFQDLSLSRGTKILLHKASVSLPHKSICAIIGRNGTGKSSLFSAILKTLSLDQGAIEISSQVQLTALSQQLPDPALSPLAFTCEGDTRWVAIMKRIAQAESDDDGDALGHAYGDLEAIDGYTLESRAATVLQGLGFTQTQMLQPLGEFSGGWQMRAQLARVLIAPSTILLLDEPTNHLDLESVTYLENWLQQYQGLALIISHDRSFLDIVSTHTLHLSQQTLTLYAGNYSSFAKQFQEALLLQSKMSQKIEQKRAHMQSFVDRFRASASKAKQAQGRIKALEKLQFSETLEDEDAFAFQFLPTDAAAYPMISLKADCGYGARVILKNAQCTLSPDDRIGIIGVNGAGKSTFLKSLAMQIPLVAGEVTHANGLRIGFYTQEAVEQLGKHQTPLEWMQSQFKTMPVQNLVSHLGKFNFTFEQMHQAIGNFSGGECARLVLASLVLQKPQLLILDEPTNHLDMPMREALIQALQSYEGAVLLVSHDRHLLECVVDSYLIIAQHAIYPFEGSLDDYAKSILQQLQAPSKNQKKIDDTKQIKPSKPNEKNVYNSLEKIDKQILELTNQQTAIDKALSDLLATPNYHEQEYKKLNTQREKIQLELDGLQEEWLKIADQ